jgi:small subunit ribosomal protein S6
MRAYETMFIVRPDVEAEDLNKVVGRVEDVIKSNGGTVVRSEILGRKRLAYEVKKHMDGIYVRINFDAPPEIVLKLREHFRFNEDVIRDLIVQQELEHREQGVPTSFVAAVDDRTDEGEGERYRDDDED